MLALNLELGLLALVIKPHSWVKKPMWLVAVILGALLAQKKIAGKLETAVALEKKKKNHHHPPPPPRPQHTPEQRKLENFCLHK